MSVHELKRKNVLCTIPIVRGTNCREMFELALRGAEFKIKILSPRTTHPDRYPNVWNGIYAYSKSENKCIHYTESIEEIRDERGTEHLYNQDAWKIKST